MAGAPDTVLPPLSVYVHLPWCVRKCPYCDFNSHRAPQSLPERAYVAALLADLHADLPHVAGRRVESLFIGGGTPSLFSPASIGALLEGIAAVVELAADCEVTLEANPGTLDTGRFAEYRAVGVNRLSIGVQSFDDALLERVGRIHTAADAYAAVKAARDAGFERVNLDLMYALPGQDTAGAADDVRAAVALEVSHVSYYHLTIEPNTLFARRRPPGLPGDEAAWAMQRSAERVLAEAGFDQYEVSAYAKPGARCRHNLNYWEFGDYLGLGAGAHGKLSRSDRVLRTLKHKHPPTYLEAARDGSFTMSDRTVSEQELSFEFMLNALRLKEGVAADLFGARTFQPLAALADTLHRVQQKGLLERSNDRLRPTALGWRFLDDLVAEFLPTNEDPAAAANAPANAIMQRCSTG